MWTAMLGRRTPTAIRLQRVRLARRVSTPNVLRRLAGIAPAVVRISTGTLRRSVRTATLVSTRLLGRLCVISASRTRWTMTLIQRHRAWPVRLGTCRWLMRSSALRVQLVSSTTHLRARRCARRARWVSTKTSRLKARALIVLLVSTRKPVGRAAARTARQASTRAQLVCGSATSASWVVTLRVGRLLAVRVQPAAVMGTATRRPHALLVRLVSTLVLSGRTAQHVRLVGPILTAILRQFVRFVESVSKLLLV